MPTSTVEATSTTRPKLLSMPKAVAGVKSAAGSTAPVGESWLVTMSRYSPGLITPLRNAMRLSKP